MSLRLDESIIMENLGFPGIVPSTWSLIFDQDACIAPSNSVKIRSKTVSNSFRRKSLNYYIALE